MLFGVQIAAGCGHAPGDVRQAGVVHLVLGVVLALHVDPGKAGEAELLPGEVEPGAGGGVDVRGEGVVEGRGHLAGHEALVDQLVQPELVPRQRGLDVLGPAVHHGGADGLVGVLGGLAGLEGVGLLGQVVRPVAFEDQRAHGVHSLVGDAGGVRADVGHQALAALAGDLHALVELLGDLHGLLGGEAQLAAGLLLEVGGGEGRGGHAAALALLDLAHGVAGILQAGDDAVGLGAGLKLHLLVPDAHEAGLHRGVVDGEHGVKGPVFLGDECLDLGLPVADDLGSDGLHAPGAQPLLDLLPEDGADLVAHQPVQHAPGLLGVDQIHIDLPGVLHRGLDGLGGHLVKLDAAGGVLGDAQHVGQVPGDGLALAVRVGREIDL